MRATVVATAILGSGSLSAAERLPSAASSCSGCHAPREADLRGAPVDLASLDPAEIAAALDDFRSGRRQGTIMPRLASGFTDAETRALAAALGRKGGVAP